MKKILVLCVLFILSFGTTVYAMDTTASKNIDATASQSMDTITSKNMDELLSMKETKSAEDMANQILSDHEEFGKKFDFRDMTKDLAAGKNPLGAQTLVQKVFSLVFSGLRDNVGIMLKLCAICILSVIVLNLYGSSQNDGVSRVAFFVFYALCAGILLSVFATAYDVVNETANNLQTFMSTMLGAMMAVGSAGGNIISAGAFYPVLLGLCGVMGVLLSKILLPLFCFTSVLTTVNHLSDEFHTKKLCELSQTVTKWVLTFSFLLFVGLLTIKGVTAAPLDALSSKTIKFAANSFVPVVGSIMSDAVETVMGAGQVIKNSLGAAGIITVIVMVLSPAVKLICLVLILKLTAALLECICDKNLSGLIWDMGTAVNMGLVFILVYGVVFIMAIASFLNVTQAAYTMR